MDSARSTMNQRLIEENDYLNSEVEKLSRKQKELREELYQAQVREKGLMKEFNDRQQDLTDQYH